MHILHVIKRVFSVQNEQKNLNQNGIEAEKTLIYQRFFEICMVFLKKVFLKKGLTNEENCGIILKRQKNRQVFSADEP